METSTNKVVSMPNDDETIKSKTIKSVTCSICQEIFTDAVMLMNKSTSCGHTYCLVCIKQWQKTSCHCPECRTVFVKFEPNYAIRAVADSYAPKREAPIQKEETDSKKKKSSKKNEHVSNATSNRTHSSTHQSHDIFKVTRIGSYSDDSSSSNIPVLCDNCTTKILGMSSIDADEDFSLLVYRNLHVLCRECENGITGGATDDRSGGGEDQLDFDTIMQIAMMDDMITQPPEHNRSGVAVQRSMGNSLYFFPKNTVPSTPSFSQNRRPATSTEHKPVSDNLHRLAVARSYSRMRKEDDWLKASEEEISDWSDTEEGSKLGKNRRNTKYITRMSQQLGLAEAQDDRTRSTLSRNIIAMPEGGIGSTKRTVKKPIKKTPKDNGIKKPKKSSKSEKKPKKQKK